MHHYDPKELFQYQFDLIELKVDMAANKAIDRVISSINDLRNEMHAFRHEVGEKLSSLDKRVVAIETRLGMDGEKYKAWYDRTLDFVFKTGWAWSSFLLLAIMSHLHVITL